MMIQSSLLSQFGEPLERVERAIAALQQGEGVLVVDDENRENEGDFVYSAQHLTTEQMAMMIREGSGIVCLHAMSVLNSLIYHKWLSITPVRTKKAYTVTIEAKRA